MPTKTDPLPGLAAWHFKEWRMSRRRREFLDWQDGERCGPGLNWNGCLTFNQIFWLLMQLCQTVRYVESIDYIPSFC